MTGLVRKATLIGVCGLLAAATAFANVPSPANSDHVDWVKVVATNAAGAPHPGQSIGGVIRDFTNNPVAGAPVVLDFNLCTDIRLCDASISGAGSVACGPPNAVTVTTNAAGQWSLTVIGGANSTGNGIGPGQDCVEIIADGVTINNATAYVVNIDARIGATQKPVNSLDLSTVKADWLKATTGGPYIGRIAYNCNPAHIINSLDLSAFKALFNANNGSATGCTIGGVQQPYCP